MNRPRTRTERLDPAIGKEIIDLFGTYRNAYAKLGVMYNISSQHFYDALRGSRVTEEVAVEIHSAWSLWKQQYLHGYRHGRKPDVFARAPWVRVYEEEEENLFKTWPPARRTE